MGMGSGWSQGNHGVRPRAAHGPMGPWAHGPMGPQATQGTGYGVWGMPTGMRGTLRAARKQRFFMGLQGARPSPYLGPQFVV